LGQRGAYGLRILGVEDAPQLLVEAAPDWPQLELVCEVKTLPPRAEILTDELAELNLQTGGRLIVDRSRGTATYAMPRRLDDHELVHPYLAPAAAVMAHWLGRPCFHAGAFVAGGRAWAVAGDRESGKSSTLAWLASRGADVVTDDVLVVDDGYALAGPRSIDLREDTAAQLGTGEALGMVGARTRWRMLLPSLAAKLPFAGWIFLEWGDDVTGHRLSPQESLARIIAQSTLRVAPLAGEALLELAALPTWFAQRPRDWNTLEEFGSMLVELAGAKPT
jgi:hypothetical protein